MQNHIIGRRQRQDLNRVPSVPKAKTLGRGGSRSRSSGARKLMGPVGRELHGIHTLVIESMSQLMAHDDTNATKV